LNSSPSPFSYEEKGWVNEILFDAY